MTSQRPEDPDAVVLGPVGDRGIGRDHLERVRDARAQVELDIHVLR
jgi:hypothetical protein